MTDSRLVAHLEKWVGRWPPPAPGVHVVGDASRLEPTWDGTVRPLVGVSSEIGTVIGVRPESVDAVRNALVDGLDDPDLGDRLGEILDVGSARFGSGVFRAIEAADAIDPTIDALGVWHDNQTPDLPDWLAPFNGPRLVARDDDGTDLGAVGIKIHDRFGYELAVVTEEAARGRGIARRLVATAARWVLDQGAVPTYLHQGDNHASAHVAEAVGFVDRGWHVHGLWPHADA